MNEDLLKYINNALVFINKATAAGIDENAAYHEVVGWLKGMRDNVQQQVQAEKTLAERKARQEEAEAQAKQQAEAENEKKAQLSAAK